MISRLIVRLPDVAEIIMGQSPPGDTYNEASVGLPFFQGKTEFGDVSPIARKWCTSPKKIALAGDILISVRAPVGPTNLADAQCCIGRGLAAIRANSAIVDPAYLRFALRYLEPYLASMGQGSTFAAIGRAELAKANFPLPNLTEQLRIVDLLSRAEGIVRLRREAQKKAMELVPSIFIEMFGDPATNPKGWPVVALGDVLSAVDYGSSTKASDDDQGVPLIRMGNVGYDGSLDLTNLKFVQLGDAEVEKYVLRTGDILFNRTNSKDLVGKTGLWNSDLHAVVASYFIRLRVKADIMNSTFLWAFMNGRFMKKTLFNTARGAIGQANINSKELKAFRIMQPPLGLQKTFERRVETIQSIRNQQTSSISIAEATFKALLSKSFST